MLLHIKYETHWISFGAIGLQLALILNFTFYLNANKTNLTLRYYTLIVLMLIIYTNLTTYL